MATFASILKAIREDSFTQRDKGTRFERLMCNYLRTSAKYNSLLEEVWLVNCIIKLNSSKKTKSIATSVLE